MGMNTSMPGQEGIPSVFSPMARTLADLQYFTRSFIQMKPWRYDHSVHPLAWRDDVEKEFSSADRKLRIGIMRTDGVVDPTPACARALQTAAAALTADGRTVFDVTPPSPYEALVIASQLLNADGCRTFLSFFRRGEANDPGAAQLAWYMRLPRPLKYLHYLWVKYVRRDPVWAGLLRGWSAKSAFENWQLVARREAYKARWHDWWRDEAGRGAGNGDVGTEMEMDVLLTTPNATPALPHGAMADAVASCGYTFLFNLLDYSAGVLPVTHVDRLLDTLPPSVDIAALNGVARGAYAHYDALKMHGLPVAVQVVGRRLEEEKVLAVMGRLEAALERRGERYELLEVE
ncbi:hypothetical protein LTR16_005326 [Cryomyces antarcticus]|uniref:Amidase domain-containing protein n=1 Tax=Cryomyces antarcticus TaxID=329879 RepID=A0ABR0LNV1_9PEZI|nr:hypothetical protein LTR60_003416 [Cryomyces antarcticus]KAK5200667.1 hypothetical protein LTR16_005326 [Cryomyces antarcticus]